MTIYKAEQAWKRLYARLGHISADVVTDLRIMYDLITMYKETRKKLDVAIFLLRQPALLKDYDMDKDEWEEWLGNDG